MTFRFSNDYLSYLKISFGKLIDKNGSDLSYTNYSGSRIWNNGCKCYPWSEWIIKAVLLNSSEFFKNINKSNKYSSTVFKTSPVAKNHL